MPPLPFDAFTSRSEQPLQPPRSNSFLFSWRLNNQSIAPESQSSSETRPKENRSKRDGKSFYFSPSPIDSSISVALAISPRRRSNPARHSPLRSRAHLENDSSISKNSKSAAFKIERKMEQVQVDKKKLYKKNSGKRAERKKSKSEKKNFLVNPNKPAAARPRPRP